MKPEHKKYILENINKKSIKEISRKLDIKEKKIRKFLEKETERQTDSEKETKRPVKDRTIFLSIVIIIILGFAVYGNSLNGEFILDDTYLIKDNTYIKSWSNVSNIFSKDIAAGTALKTNFYRPFQTITLIADYSLWGLNAKGYHLTNIFLHILAALTIYWLINILYKDSALSLFTGILFITHPVHTEAIAYISGRADPSAALFMILCFIFYIKYFDSERPVHYILMLSSYILALLSRESSLILPVLILFYHHTSSGGKNKIKIKEFTPILIIAFIYVLLRITILKSLLSNVLYPTALFQRIPGFFVAIINYIRLMLLPFNLHMEYGNELFSMTNPKAILGILTSSFLLFYAFRKRASDNLIFFSICWFFIALLPQSNIYPINAYMAEHWLYLPSIGFFLVLAKGLNYIYRKKGLRVIAAVFIICLSVFYSYLTVKQNYYWREPLTFYKRTLEYAPDNAKMVNNLAHLYYDIGKKEEAIIMFKKAIEINPHFAEAYNNLGIIYYYDKNNSEEAIALFKEAVENNPDFAGAYNNLGIVYKNIGKIEEAIASHKKAIEINPDYATAHYDLSLLYFHEKQYFLAVKYCDRAIELGYEAHPGFLEMLKPYRR